MIDIRTLPGPHGVPAGRLEPHWDLTAAGGTNGPRLAGAPLGLGGPHLLLAQQRLLYFSMAALRILWSRKLVNELLEVDQNYMATSALFGITFLY